MRGFFASSEVHSHKHFEVDKLFFLTLCRVQATVTCIALLYFPDFTCLAFFRCQFLRLTISFSHPPHVVVDIDWCVP